MKRILLFLAVVLALAGRAETITKNLTSTWGGSSSTVTAVYNTATGAVTVSCSALHDGGGGTVVWIGVYNDGAHVVPQESGWQTLLDGPVWAHDWGNGSWNTYVGGGSTLVGSAYTTTGLVGGVSLTGKYMYLEIRRYDGSYHDAKKVIFQMVPSTPSEEKWNKFTVTNPWPYPTTGATSAVSRAYFEVDLMDSVSAVISTQRYECKWAPAYGGMYRATLTVHGDAGKYPKIVVRLYVQFVLAVASAATPNYTYRIDGDLTHFEKWDFGSSAFKYSLSEINNSAFEPEVLLGNPESPAPADVLPDELYKSQKSFASGGSIKPEEIGDVPNPTSATAAATSGDVKNGSQAIVDAIKVLDGHVQSGGGSATDMTATNGKLDTLNTAVGGLETRSQRDAKITDGQTAANSDATTKGNAAQGKMDSASNSAASTGNGLESSGMMSSMKGVATGNPFGTDNGYAWTEHIVADVGLFKATGIDTNPFTSAFVAEFLGGGSLSAWAAWVRNFITWACCLGFLMMVAAEVYETCKSLGMTTPMPLSNGTQIVLRTAVLGNSVGVPAAGILWAVTTVVYSTLLLAAPALIVAAWSTASGAPSVTTQAASALSAASAGLTTIVSNALSYINRFLPLALLATIYVNRLLVKVAAVTKYVVYSIGVKISSL